MDMTPRTTVDPQPDSYAVVRPESPGNVWGFWTEAAAVAAVRDHIARFGADAVADWSLVRVPADQDADWQTIAESQELVAAASILHRDTD